MNFAELQKYIFISLISGNDSNHHREYSGDEIVETIHEEGTFQSYYNYSKIEKLINGTKFRLEWGSLIFENQLWKNPSLLAIGFCSKDGSSSFEKSFY